MFSIGEFSRLSGLTVKTLRFYHDRGLLTPAIVDPQSGYRYYDERNLELAYVIVGLRDLEFSLDEIASILDAVDDDQDLLEYLERQKDAIGRKLQHYQQLDQRIDQVIHQQREAREVATMQQRTYEIEERVVPSQLVAGVRMKGRYCDCGQGFARLARAMGRHIAGKPLCLYYDGDYREEDADFEPCFPARKQIEVDGIQWHTLPAVRCITLIHQGPYENLRRSYARAMQYAKQKGYELQLPTREVYLKGPGMIFRGNPKKYLTEIQLPIEES